jgi:hypothetical protein
MTDKNEIARLSTENSELRARLAAVEDKLAPKRPPVAPVEEGARVTVFAPTSSFVMPSDNEIRQLFKFAIVRLTQMDRAPDFSGARREEKQDEFYGQFCAAFEALGAITRAPELDKKHAFTYWVGKAEEILRTCQYGSVPRLAPAFLAAAIAHGDILYNDPREYPYILEFGLRDYGMGKPATDGWKKILAAGKAPEPTTVKARSFGRDDFEWLDDNKRKNGAVGQRGPNTFPKK